jgi:hypothetical protein
MKRTTMIAIFAALVFMSADMRSACAYTLFVQRGSELAGILTTTLGSRESRAGDPVVLEIRGTGIPEGTQVRGRLAGLSSFSPGHAATLNVLLDTLNVPGEAPVRMIAHVLSLASPRKSAFSRIRGGFQLVSSADGDLLLKKGTRIRLQAVEDLRVGEEAPAPASQARARSQDAPPRQSAHPYDAGGEMPY